jgi:hypothetical protein
MSDSTTITGADIASAVSASSETQSTPDASAAASTTSSTAQPEAATSQPASEGDDLNDPSWGDIPASRRPSIAANFRKKAEAERKAAIEAAQREWDTKTGWAKDIDPQDAAIVSDWVRRGKTDPAGLVADLFARVQNDPNHGPRLRSEAARILNSGRANQPAEDPMPPPDIPTDASNGQPVVYSASQLQKLLDWQHRRSMGQFKQELAPFQQDLQVRQQHEEQRQLVAQADRYGQTTLKSLVDQPGFKDHKDAIAKEYAAMGIRDPRTGEIVPDPNDPRSEGEKLRDAYLKVVVPTLSASVRQQTVADLHRKANANTVSPNATSVAEPFDYRKSSLEEALAYEWSKRKTG